MPSVEHRSRLMSESIGNGRSFRSGWLLRHARWTNSESMLPPRIWASRSWNSRFSLPNAAISVGHTKVKSLGQKEEDSPLACVVLVGNGFECVVFIRGDGSGKTEIRKLLSYA